LLKNLDFVTYKPEKFCGLIKDDWEDVKANYHLLGVPLIPLNSPYLYHLSGETIRTLAMDRYSQTMKNKDIYHQKWKGKWDQVFERAENGN